MQPITMRGNQMIRKLFYILFAFLCFSVAASTFAASFKVTCNTISTHPKRVECIYQFDNESLYANTNSPYALCSESLCTTTTNTAIALCICPVYGMNENDLSWKNASVGPKNFSNSKPKTKNSQLISVVSNFSLANFTKVDRKDLTTCQFNQSTPWANCFGTRCNIHYRKQGGKATAVAVCLCPIVKSAVFAASGPSSSQQCSTAPHRVWSAIDIKHTKNIGVSILNVYQQYYPHSPLTQRTK